jgi:GNAT superfamily N-acetyltransferase
MVLVHPDYRRRGIGRALLEQCTRHLQARGVRCIKLDATPLGRTLYQDLGFQDEWTLRRWVGRVKHPLAERPEARLRPWRESDAASVALLDTTAFGVPRGRLLGGLVNQSCAAWVLEAERGSIAAYGLLRRSARVAYLGPVVANTVAAGRRVLVALLNGCVGPVICWDIPDPNRAAVIVAEELGFRVERPLTRM